MFVCLHTFNMLHTHITHKLHNFWFAVVVESFTIITLIVFIQAVWTPVQGRWWSDRRETRLFERRRMGRCPRSPGWEAGCTGQRRTRWPGASPCCCTSCRRGLPPACPRPPCRRGRGSWRASPPRSPRAPAAAAGCCLNLLHLLILRRSYSSCFQQVDECQVHGKPELGRFRFLSASQSLSGNQSSLHSLPTNILKCPRINKLILLQ